MDTNSCLEIKPESNDFCKYLWNYDNILLFLNACLFVFSVYTTLPGYHFINSSFGNYLGSYIASLSNTYLFSVFYYFIA